MYYTIQPCNNWVFFSSNWSLCPSCMKLKRSNFLPICRTIGNELLLWILMTYCFSTRHNQHLHAFPVVKPSASSAYMYSEKELWYFPGDLYMQTLRPFLNFKYMFWNFLYIIPVFLRIYKTYWNVWQIVAEIGFLWLKILYVHQKYLYLSYSP